MTTITMRYIGEAFLVSGKDIEARKFASRREAKDWCASRYPGSPIHEIGADSTKRMSRAMPRKGLLLARGAYKKRTPPSRAGFSDTLCFSPGYYRAFPPVSCELNALLNDSCLSGKRGPLIIEASKFVRQRS
jgi:hypothetical protein